MASTPAPTRLPPRPTTNRRRTRLGSPPPAAASANAEVGEFRLDRLAIERLHEEFVGARMHGARDERNLVLGGAEYDFRLLAARHLPQLAQEIVAVEARHAAVDEDRVGHQERAGGQRLPSVGGLGG